jgi:N-acetylglucosamine-6-phosphate deacetylase
MLKDVPGLVDLQINGWGGIDFSDAALTDESFARACQGIFDSGTSAFVPTIVTSGLDVYENNLPIIAKAIKKPELAARVLGVHIEGPFISPSDGARGAHPLQHVKEPDIDFFDRLNELADGNVKILTVAAELKGVDALIRHAIQKGVCVSLGHHLAHDDDIAAAAKAGAKGLTHLGNGVPSNVNRHANPIWAALAEDDLTAMIITDSHHVPAALIKTILKVKGVDNTIVVSDGTAMVGMPPGKYNMFGADVLLDETGKLYNPVTGYLAGSGSTMLQCINYLASLKFLTFEQLIQVGYYNPLKFLDLDIQPETKALKYDDQECKFLVE